MTVARSQKWRIASSASGSRRRSPEVATMTGSTTSTAGGFSSSQAPTAAMISVVPSMPVLTASSSTSSDTERSCRLRKSEGGVWMAWTPVVFWATRQVTAVIANPPAALIDLVSAAVPAPPDGSVPAMDRTLGRAGRNGVMRTSLR
jgi:hypothetical protein